MFTDGVEPKPNKPSNIAKRSEFGHGDVEAGFARGRCRHRESFRTEATHQGYIEPHACVATVVTDGSGEMWVCTQGHFMVRNALRALLGMDVSRLRVTASEIGGGFGGKTHVWMEPIALALSRKAEPAGEDRDDARGGVQGLRSDLVHLDRRQDGREEGRHASPPRKPTLRYQAGAFPGSWAEPAR